MERTLLFTDLVASTALVERLGDAGAAELWAEHDRQARDLLAAHGGQEVDHTDGFLLMFEAPTQAVRYALAYQEVITRHSLVARTGLHIGAVILRPNTQEDVDRGAKRIEVEGLAKPFAARIMSMAAPGQILLSKAAAALIGGASDVPFEIECHGHYRLKGIDEPAEVFELGVRGSSSPFSPPLDSEKAYRVVFANGLWQPAREVRNNLPEERDAFIGRTDDLRFLSARLDSGVRLVTVLGPAGTGKTRLARRYGRTWLGDWPGGVYFCDLSEAKTLEGILFAVASSLEMSLGKENPAAQVGHAIAGRGRCLLILDNFEQIASYARETVSTWLDRTSLAAFLVTSRERLDVPGEVVFPLEPLPIGKDAIDLFCARARAQDPTFELIDTNRAAVAEVVRLVDGLPLAIELAAARVRVLSPSQLVHRMRDRFALLAGTRGRAARQATLRAAIDWSWELLAPWEQDALAQCAVFEGGFTLGAAEAVIDSTAWPPGESALSAVQALVDKSLLRTWLASDSVSASVDERYFGMYMSIHEYANLRLEEKSSVVREAAFERHSRYYATFGSDPEVEKLFRRGGRSLRDKLALAVDNIAIACGRSIRRSDAQTAGDCYRAVWEVIELRGPFSLGAALGADVVSLTGAPAAIRAKACATAGPALRLSGRVEQAKGLLDEALLLAKAVGDRRLEGIVLGSLGTLHMEQGRMDEARSHHEAALAIHHEVGNSAAEGNAHSSLGSVHFERGRTAEAQVHLEAAVAIQHALENRRDEGIALANLAALHFDQGRSEEARTAYESSRAIAREIGNRRVEGVVLGNLGIVHHELGRWDAALSTYEAALAIHREMGNRRFESSVLCNLGNLHLEQGRPEAAHLNYQAAHLISRELGDRRQEALVLANLGNLEREHGDVDKALVFFEDALRLNRAVGNQRDEGIVLGIIADIFLQGGRFVAACKEIEISETLLRGVGNPLELAKVLCVKGQLEAKISNMEGAYSALVEAEEVSKSIGADAGSELGRKIRLLRETLGATPAS